MGFLEAIKRFFSNCECKPIFENIKCKPVIETTETTDIFETYESDDYDDLIYYNKEYNVYVNRQPDDF